MDGDTVKTGPWSAKPRTEHRSGRFDTEHERRVAALFDVTGPTWPPPFPEPPGRA
ncbi:hypothetical protein [Streptomyces sp. NPDC055287]